MSLGVVVAVAVVVVVVVIIKIIIVIIMVWLLENGYPSRPLQKSTPFSVTAKAALSP